MASVAGPQPGTGLRIQGVPADLGAAVKLTIQRAGEPPSPPGLVEWVQTGEEDGKPVLYWRHALGSGAIDLASVVSFTVAMDAS